MNRLPTSVCALGLTVVTAHGYKSGARGFQLGEIFILKKNFQLTKTGSIEEYVEANNREEVTQ